MKERPILMNEAMVRAVLAGQKKVTRRLVKPAPPAPLPHSGGLSWEWSEQLQVFQPCGSIGHIPMPMKMGIRCPFGVVGDRLWVREAWGLHGYGDFTWWCRDSIRGRAEDELRSVYQVAYAADATSPCDFWRPSIHMPRWASRIDLEITGVRVERLVDITEEDALAEGISVVPFVPDDGFPLSTGYMPGPDDRRSALSPTAREAFQRLWESINGAGSWEESPWVWRIEFRRVERSARAA